MKVLDLGNNDVIQCSTLEENDQILDLFLSLGLKWCNGLEYKDHQYDRSKKYIIDGGVGYVPKEGVFTGIDHYIGKRNIYPASLFLTPTYEIY